MLVNHWKVIEGGWSKIKRKAIFLDRDGTINKDTGFIKNENEIELLPGAADAIRKINELGYLAIIITNQAVVARGEVTIEGLNIIHNKLRSCLEVFGAHIDDIYYCPHYPEKGFIGERKEYKIVCKCIKPQPGLILQAVKDYDIDVANSWMVGDSIRDIMAGESAGCNTALLCQNGIGDSGDYKLLVDFVNSVLDKNNKLRCK